MVRMSFKRFKLVLSAALFAGFATGGAITSLPGIGDAAYAGEVTYVGSGQRSKGSGGKIRTVRRSVLDGNYNRQRSNRGGNGSVRYGSARGHDGSRNGAVRYNRNRGEGRNSRVNSVPIYNDNTNTNNNTNRNVNTNNNTNRNVNTNNNTNTIIINNSVNARSDRGGTRLGKQRNKLGSARSYNSGEVRSVMRRVQNNRPVGFNEIAGSNNGGSVTNIYERNNVVDFGSTIIYGGTGLRQAAGNGGGISANSCRYGTYCTINLGGPKIITFNNVPDYDDGLNDENLSEEEYKKKYGSK